MSAYSVLFIAFDPSAPINEVCVEAVVDIFILKFGAGTELTEQIIRLPELSTWCMIVYSVVGPIIIKRHKWYIVASADLFSHRSSLSCEQFLYLVKWLYFAFGSFYCLPYLKLELGKFYLFDFVIVITSLYFLIFRVPMSSLYDYTCAYSYSFIRISNCDCDCR